MSVNKWNKDIEYVSVKDMSLEQLVSFCEFQYKDSLKSWFVSDEEGGGRNSPTLKEFINSVCVNADKSMTMMPYKVYPNASLPKAVELLSNTFFDFYPFREDEFIPDLSQYIDEQQGFHRSHSVPNFLPLNRIDFSHYDLGRISVIDGTKLIECFYYPYLQRYVYRVSIPCSICGKERVHTLRMTLEEYKKLVKYHARIVSEAQERIETEERWKYNADRINIALKHRFRIPNSQDSYTVKTLMKRGIDITFISSVTNEVICNSSGKIKGVRPFTREDFTYKLTNGTCVEAYHLGVYLEGVMFQGKEVKALGDIRPLDMVQENLDISSPWYLYLEEPFKWVHPYSLELVKPYADIFCLLNLLED